MFLVFLKTEITPLHRKAFLKASWGICGLYLPQDAQGVSTEEVVVTDVLVSSDIYHLQNQEQGEAVFLHPLSQARNHKEQALLPVMIHRQRFGVTSAPSHQGWVIICHLYTAKAHTSFGYLLIFLFY